MAAIQSLQSQSEICNLKFRRSSCPSSTRAACFPSRSRRVALPDGREHEVGDRAASAVGRADPDAGRRPRDPDPPVPPQRPPRASGSCRPAASIRARRPRPRRRASARKRSARCPDESNGCAALYPTPGFCDEELIFFRVSELGATAARFDAPPRRGRGHPPAGVHDRRGAGDGRSRRDRRPEDRLRPDAAVTPDGFFDGRDVDVDRVVDAPGVAARERDHERHAGGADRLDDQPIARAQAVLRQAQGRRADRPR